MSEEKVILGQIAKKVILRVFLGLKSFLYSIGLIVLIVVIFTIYKTPNIINSWPKINLQLSSLRLPDDTKILPKKPRQFAIFASSIHSILRSYIFYTPIAAAAWQRIGYEVIVVFVGDFTNDSSNASLSVQLNLSRTFLQRLGVHILNFQCDKSYSVKMSQLVRIFAGYLSDRLVSDDDYILTTDSDIIPINKQDYQLKANTSGFLYNAFCCGSFERRGKSYHMYPLSHICLSKKMWRDLFLESIQRKEIFNSNLSSLNPILLSDKAPFSFETISLYTRQEFGQMYDSNMSKGDSAWYMDQIYSSMLITDYNEKYPNIIINKRSKASRRLDPHLPDFMWEPERLQKFGDAHIIHDEIFYSYRWKLFKNLLFVLFNSSLVNDFDFYYKQYTLDLLQNSKDY